MSQPYYAGQTHHLVQPQPQQQAPGPSGPIHPEAARCRPPAAPMLAAHLYGRRVPAGPTYDQPAPPPPAYMPPPSPYYWEGMPTASGPLTMPEAATLNYQAQIRAMYGR